MPVIYEYFGLVFFFYSREHTPVHVHVKRGDRQTIFELITKNGTLKQIKERQNSNFRPLSTKDKETARAFIKKYHRNIIDKWVGYFVEGRKIRTTTIKKKL